ncbi:MAG: CIA30 family protein [Gammaproteobacteria bacterium]
MKIHSTRLDLNVDPWTAVNDGVMGGKSSGNMTAIETGLRFSGTLSLENNGGFSSVRTPLNTGLDGVDSVQLKVIGDGRIYQLRLRLNNSQDGVSWRHEFKTTHSENEWQLHRLPLKHFVPVFRGKTLVNYDRFDPARVCQLGFLLADGHAHSFQLDIAAIEFLS